MRILTRYLLRLHVAPFLFAVTGLTLLLLLDQVSKRFEGLIGKGLHWTVIAEVFVYSIPFILAQTLPMAVLIAVLYTFNHLAADHEITAIKASGIPLARLLLPLLLAATLLAGGMTWFNNTILPESNHHLQVLLTGIGRKKPTFYLRERTINEVLPGRLYVQPGRIDRDSSLLHDAVIYDERDGRRSRTIYADSGRMAFSPDGEDLYLTLHHGVLQERVSDNVTDFQRVAFDGLTMRVAGVANDLERDTLNAYRSDREMNIAQMREEVRAGKERVTRAVAESREYALALAEMLVVGEIDMDTLETAVLETLPDPGRPNTTGRDSGPPIAADTAVRVALDSAAILGRQLARRVTHPNNAAHQFTNYGERIATGQAHINKFAVEIHKKYTIPAACIIFVLIGAPIAIRYPRGGVALVVGVGLAFFAAYYVSLVGGEELADHRIVSAFWAMWAPNVLFGLIGLGAMWRATRVTR
jgi:lipopolysaccharide export system permease protein